jgi:aspartate racemase
MKKMAVIGGLSPASSLHYYERINQLVLDRLGDNNSADMILRSVNFEEYCEMQRQGDWELSGQKLAQEALSLKSIGYEFFVLATNTMHIVADHITDALGDTPFIHIADATADEALKQKFQTVAFLGTKYSMDMDFYTGCLEERGLTTLIPKKEEDRDEINRIIFDELTKNTVNDVSREFYIQAILGLKARGAEAVILGCTEIGMLINEGNSPLPVLDTTEIHAQRAVDFALS